MPAPKFKFNETVTKIHYFCDIVKEPAGGRKLVYIPRCESLIDEKSESKKVVVSLAEANEKD